jgi:hypothetical protein
MRLNRSMAEYEKLNGSARQALMADEPPSPATRRKWYTQAAEAFANRLIAVEHEIDRPRPWSQSSQASEQAKAASTKRAAPEEARRRQKLLRN